MFVVNSHQLFVHGVRVKLFLKFGEVIVGESLRAIGVGGCFEDFLTVLLGGGAGCVLNGVFGTDEFEQGADIGFLGGIDEFA
jgi:hypothetical protein